MSIISEYVNRYSLATISAAATFFFPTYFTIDKILYSLLKLRPLIGIYSEFSIFRSTLTEKFLTMDTDSHSSSNRKNSSLNSLDQEIEKHNLITIKLINALAYGVIGYVLGFLVEKIDKFIIDTTLAFYYNEHTEDKIDYQKKEIDFDQNNLHPENFMTTNELSELA